MAIISSGTRRYTTVPIKTTTNTNTSTIKTSTNSAASSAANAAIAAAQNAVKNAVTNTSPSYTPVVSTTTKPATTTPTASTPSSGATYTHNGKTYTNYADWVAAQTGATAAQVQQAQALAGNNHTNVLAALKGYNTPNAGILAQAAIEKSLADQYAKWQGVQDDPLAYLYGTSFEEALAANGGIEAIYRNLQKTGTTGVNQGLTDAQLAEMMQRVTGGNTAGAEGGYSLPYKLVNGIEDEETAAYKAALGSVGMTEALGEYGVPGASGATSGGTAASTSNPAALIQELYAAQQEAALAALKSAYDENVLALDASAREIPSQYQAARNRTAADAAVNARNFNQYAAANGLNNGAAGQAQLAMNNQLQSGLSGISQAEADALASLELERTRAKTQYQNSVAQAIADGDVAKAQALYEEAVRVDENLIAAAYQQAQLAYQQATLDRALANDQVSNAMTTAQFLAGLGDIEGAYAALGMTAPASVLPSATSGWTGQIGGGTGDAYTEAELQAARWRYENGKPTDRDFEVLTAAGELPSSTQNPTPDGEDSLETNAGNFSPSYSAGAFYDQPMTSVRPLVSSILNDARSAPTKQAQLTLVQNNARSLTDAEYQYVLRNLGLI